MAYLFQATVLFLSLANITKFDYIVLKTLWCGAEASKVGIIMRSRSSNWLSFGSRAKIMLLFLQPILYSQPLLRTTGIFILYGTFYMY